MHILLAAATIVEIQPTVDYLATRQSHPHVSTLITGVGCLSTTWSLMRQVEKDPPDLIIQAGIGGSFTGRRPGEVFAVFDETPADLGVWEDGRFRTLFDLRLADPDEAPFSNGRLLNPHKPLLALSGLEAVSSVTVNEISTNPDRIKGYRQYTSATLESMEGAALHYVCLQERIAFLQIRSVSNDVGIRDKSKWNIPLAIRQLNERVIALLEKLAVTDNSILNAFNDTE